MEKKNKFYYLKRKLNILYTVTTGLVLTAFFASAFLLNQSNTSKLVEERFNSCVNAIESKVITDSYVSDKWLKSYEEQNNLTIFAFDNGNPLFHNITSSNLVRNELFNSANKTLLENNVDIMKKPISLQKIESNFYILTNREKKYIFCGISCSAKNGFSSVLILQECDEFTSGLMINVLIFLLIDIIGISLLSVLGRFLINKMTAPAEESEKRQSEFIAAVSHELKSPLAVICTQNSAHDADRKISSKIIDDECKRMSRLIEDMLFLAFCKTERWSVKEEKVNIDLVISDVYEMFAPLAQEKNIEIHFNLPDDELPNVSGDYQRIVQVLSAITDNALSYSENGKSIEISAYSKKNKVYIEIADHGKGISDEEKPIIFEKFYRSEKSRTDKSHFGLGLNISKELISQMNGEISVSDTEGGGATFIISLKSFDKSTQKTVKV